MQSRDFVYWLQGFFEISGADSLTAEQVKAVRNHLNLVFKHEIDPAFGDAAHQEKLNEAHSGRPLNPGPHGPHDIILKC